MTFPTVEEWDQMSAKGRQTHAAWLLVEATRNADQQFDGLTPNQTRALELVADAFDMDAFFNVRIAGLQAWNDELRTRLSAFYRSEASYG